MRVGWKGRNDRKNRNDRNDRNDRKGRKGGKRYVVKDIYSLVSVLVTVSVIWIFSNTSWGTISYQN